MAGAAHLDIFGMARTEMGRVRSLKRPARDCVAGTTFDEVKGSLYLL